MLDIWIMIVIVGALIVCLVGMIWSAITYLRQRAYMRQQAEIVQSRQSAVVSARSATLPGARVTSPDFTTPRTMSPTSTLSWDDDKDYKRTFSPV